MVEGRLFSHPFTQKDASRNKCLTSSNKKLLGAPGLTTGNNTAMASNLIGMVSSFSVSFSFPRDMQFPLVSPVNKHTSVLVLSSFLLLLVRHLLLEAMHLFLVASLFSLETLAISVADDMQFLQAVESCQLHMPERCALTIWLPSAPSDTSSSWHRY